MFVNLAYLDEHGNLASSILKGDRWNFAGHEFFRVHQMRSSDEIYIGKPVVGRNNYQFYAATMSARDGTPADGEGAAPRHFAQLDFLADNECDEMQGYYCSRPLPAVQATELLRGTRRLITRPQLVSVAA